MRVRSLVLLIVLLAAGTNAAIGADAPASSTDPLPIKPVDPFVVAAETAAHPPEAAAASLPARPPVGAEQVPLHASLSPSATSPPIALPKVALPPPSHPAEASAPAAPAATLSDADQVLRNLVAATRDTLADKVKPPPAEITLKDGVTEMIPVSQGRMNRLLTPFPDPIVKLNDSPDADVSRSGSILYVLPTSTNSVSMFVMDRSDPDHAMSLTLVPASIPPVQVTLHLGGWVPPAPKRPTREASNAVNSSEPYVQSIVLLFRELALGKIPAGYSLSASAPKDAPGFRCTWAGVRVQPAQWVEGTNVEAVIAKAVNTSMEPVDLDESACRSERLAGVATWPSVHLEPGEATEVYVALRRADLDHNDSDRPSLLNTAGGR